MFQRGCWIRLVTDVVAFMVSFAQRFLFLTSRSSDSPRKGSSLTVFTLLSGPPEVVKHQKFNCMGGGLEGVGTFDVRV